MEHGDVRMKIRDLLVKDIKYYQRPGKRKTLVLKLMQQDDKEKFESKIKDYTREDSKFEKRAFIHLFDNVEKHAIEKIFVANNMRVDGLLELDDGKVILLEMKYRLNWFKSSNARVEFQTFVTDPLIQKEFQKHFPEKQPEGALIIFERFSHDWEKRTWNSLHEDGWSLFYEEEETLRKKFPTIPVDVTQFVGNELIPAPWLCNEWRKGCTLR